MEPLADELGPARRSSRPRRA